MDRRRRAQSLARLSSKQFLGRRKRQITLPKFFSSKGTIYAIISLVFFSITLIFISILEEQPEERTIYPTISLTSTNSTKHASNKTISHSPFASSGSTKQLHILLKNITQYSGTKVKTNTQTSPIIVAVAVNYAYRVMALNFICNLNRLNISNYLVLAMDRAVYDYLSTRGAHVFLHEVQSILSPTRRKLMNVNKHDKDNKAHIEEDALFGSAAFVETSRRKSMLLLKVLRLGYSVLFSDVDVIWVRNPIPVLTQYKSDFVIQSDRSYKDKDAPLNYNLNSGFYLVRSSSRSVTALQAIVKYAQAVRRSEQKAFNYILCGAFKDHHAGPGLRVGNNECMYSRSQIRAEALPLDAFPNGSDERFTDASFKSISKLPPEVIIIHANYVVGQSRKVEKIQKLGFWFHSTQSTRTDGCIIGLDK